MAALTPHRVSVHGGVSPLHVLALPDHSVPNHPTSSRGRFLTLPLSAAGVLADQTSPSPSGLVTTPDRNGFALLRTGRSPPVALHPALRRRSYSRLQAGERMPEVDSHHSVRVPSRAHWEASPVSPNSLPQRCLGRPKCTVSTTDRTMICVYQKFLLQCTRSYISSGKWEMPDR